MFRGINQGQILGLLEMLPVIQVVYGVHNLKLEPGNAATLSGRASHVQNVPVQNRPQQIGV